MIILPFLDYFPIIKACICKIGMCKTGHVELCLFMPFPLLSSISITYSLRVFGETQCTSHV